MRIDRLTLSCFRNLVRTDLTLTPGVNIFYGENAQGKTNLLEAAWLFTGGKSFRGAADKELVRIGAATATVTGHLFAEEREQVAVIEIENRRKAILNGISLPSASKLAGTFCAVVFSPDHLRMVKGGPDGRRRFIDAAYCQIRPAYIKILSEYQKTLSQRNALIKTRCPDDELLRVFDERMAITGMQVMAARRAYLKKLEPIAAKMHNGISTEREALTFRYQPTGDADTAEALYERIRAARSADLAAGFSTVGPHRDEWDIEINGESLRKYGSQGQQRSAVLSIKLAEAALAEQVRGEPPIILLDDVMSELDVTRQDYLLSNIEGWQVLITCCDPEPVKRYGQKCFHVVNGRIGE